MDPAARSSEENLLSGATHQGVAQDLYRLFMPTNIRGATDIPCAGG